MSRVTGKFSLGAPSERRATRQVRLAAPLLLAFLAIQACTVGKPQVPSTDWTLRLPVADDRTTILEVVKDRSDYLQIREDQSMGLRINTVVNQREVIGDRLSVSPVRPDPVETELGAITIPGRKIDVPALSLNDLVEPDPPSDTGIAISIPATGIDTEVKLDLSASVQELAIIEGGIDITITNGLPVPLDIGLVLIDKGPNNDQADEVATLNLGRIDPNSAPASGEFLLDGLTITGNLAIVVVGTTVASDDVLIEGSPSLQISAGLRDLTVERAIAKIPQQDLPEDVLTIDFPDDRIQVTSAEIRRGGLTLRVRNDIPIIVSVTLTMDDFQDESGNKLVIPIDDLEPLETKTQRVSLDGITFLPSNPLQLRVLYSAKTDSTNDFKEISSDATISVSAETEKLFFGEVQGILKNLTLDVDPVTQTLNVPEGLDNLGIATTSVEAWITSGVGFGSTIELLVEGTNNSGESLSFTMERDFAPGDPDEPKVIVVAPESATLTDFLNLLPSTITVTPSVRVGDGVSTERIAPEHWVQIDSVVFQSEARFQIKEDDRIEVAPVLRELEDENARTRISNNLKSAAVITMIENHIPLAVRVSLLVAPTLEEVYTNPILTIPSDGEGFGVEAAPTDPTTGRASSSTSAERTVTLTKEEVLVFLREGGVYTGVLVEFDKTEGGADGFVELLGSDWVSVQAATEVVIELNESLVK